MKARTKVAIIVGAPMNVGNRFDERSPLVYIYFKKHFLSENELIVQPARPEYAAFAKEAKRRILARIERDPMQTFVYPNPTHESPHGRKIVGIKDPNVIEGIAHSLHLWDDGKGIVAGHYVLPSYSYVEERKV